MYVLLHFEDDIATNHVCIPISLPVFPTRLHFLISTTSLVEMCPTTGVGTDTDECRHSAVTILYAGASWPVDLSVLHRATHKFCRGWIVQ